MRTSKSLAERIDIAYWTQRHALRRWKIVLSAGAAVIAAGWLAVAAGVGDQRIYQAGPLSRAHAMFENDCAQCHTESWQPVRRLLAGDNQIRSVPDSACLRCHDGPVHHENQIAAGVHACADCHREHRGHMRLADVSDAMCVSCHADLRTSTGPSRFEARVDRFALSSNGSGHPEFGLLRRGERDSAAIRFNHAVHLAAGGVLASGGSLEVLRCDSCHEPDAERRYMAAINHERHCARCHVNALVFDSDRFADRPAPHGDPEMVRAAMLLRYTEHAKQNAESLEAPRAGADRRVPGRWPAPALSPEQWDWVREQVAQAERVVFSGAGGCSYCHTVEATPAGWTVQSPNIPNRWFMHGEFRHDSHRMLGCEQCHAVRGSRDTSDVLLPSIETCFECHGRSSGKARSDCAECHRYHDRSLERSFDGPMKLR